MMYMCFLHQKYNILRFCFIDSHNINRYIEVDALEHIFNLLELTLTTYLLVIVYYDAVRLTIYSRVTHNCQLDSTNQLVKF